MTAWADTSSPPAGKRAIERVKRTYLPRARVGMVGWRGGVNEGWTGGGGRGEGKEEKEKEVVAICTVFVLRFSKKKKPRSNRGLFGLDWGWTASETEFGWRSIPTLGAPEKPACLPAWRGVAWRLASATGSGTAAASSENAPRTPGASLPACLQPNSNDFDGVGRKVEASTPHRPVQGRVTYSTFVSLFVSFVRNGVGFQLGLGGGSSGEGQALAVYPDERVGGKADASVREFVGFGCHHRYAWNERWERSTAYLD
ncbi:hypothetical protein F5148DRAFT_1146069 [Russula earlei]|uniref:Uncharacterized protein n=1 Tax=Russula earlei TaxID=71964 RepID=A0ACC0ULJ4_9AGAM|nr:hypothetical protein F5148DRAFT_1146069 [Russula earlei]